MDKRAHLKLVIQCLTIVGFWPLEFNKTIYQFLYSMYFRLTLTIFAMLIVSEVIELYRVVTFGQNLDLSVLMGFSMFHLLGFVKLKVASGAIVRRLVRNIKATEDAIFKESDEKVKQIYIKYVELNYTCNKFMIRITLICGVIFVMGPYFVDRITASKNIYEIIENGTIIYKPRPLPLETWFPFDRYKYYYVSYCWHVIALFSAPTYIIGFNILFYSLTIFATGQLKILQYYLANLRNGTKDVQQTRQNGIITENLLRCLQYHKKIIIYVAELSDAMKTFLLIDFFGCSLQIAIIGFQTAVMDVSLQFVKALIYLATVLTQLFFLYWFANEVLLESLNVSKMAWESGWYEYSEDTKRNLLFIILRSQKPLTLSIGPFSYMSTEALMTILRYSYSYAMLMRRLYRD